MESEPGRRSPQSCYLLYLFRELGLSITNLALLKILPMTHDSRCKVTPLTRPGTPHQLGAEFHFLLFVLDLTGAISSSTVDGPRMNELGNLSGTARTDCSSLPTIRKEANNLDLRLALAVMALANSRVGWKRLRNLRPAIRISPSLPTPRMALAAIIIWAFWNCLQLLPHGYACVAWLRPAITSAWIGCRSFRWFPVPTRKTGIRSTSPWGTSRDKAIGRHSERMHQVLHPSKRLLRFQAPITLTDWELSAVSLAKNGSSRFENPMGSLLC